MHKLLSIVAICAASASVASAQQIILSPANEIGGTAPYSDPQFARRNVLDQQTGDISEPLNVQQGYWLNPDGGPQDAFIVIDLGQPYQLSEIQLFNTHNAQYNDRGTGAFTITGSNTIVPVSGAGQQGSDISGGTLLVSGTLSPEVMADDPINAQSFSVTDTGAYQYIRFDAETVAAGGTSCCGANNYGLNELRVFQVPEPTVLSLLLPAAGALLMRRRRA